MYKVIYDNTMISFSSVEDTEIAESSENIKYICCQAALVSSL